MIHPEDNSFEPETFRQETVEQLAQQAGISVGGGQVVYENWLLLASIAQPLMDFRLPQSLDPAPRFEP